MAEMQKKCNDVILKGKLAILERCDNNCGAHIANSSLKYIKFLFLPANKTSSLQSCDQGIIRVLKVYYCREMCTRILENMEETQQKGANDLANI
jgi:hypothetical protein